MTTTRQPAIVVGVSGSPASLTALRWAAGETARLHGQLRAVLIWTSQPYAPYVPQPRPPSQEQCRERAHRDLATAVRAVFGPVLPGYLVTEVVEGQPERVLADQSAGADLLVLGSASAHSPAGPSLGPVIRTCLSRAHCPVVVVGPEGLPGGAATADPPGTKRQLADATS
jgi:nucleotide-binding universal stress UspA family protein